jgi:pseudaminic acid synthase
MMIRDRVIGSGHPTYVIAEMSANHCGDFDLAVKTLHAAKEAGADAIKLQTYTADTLTLASNRDYFNISNGTLWDGRTLHELYQEAAMPWEWQQRLKTAADDIDLTLFSSAFDASAVEFLEKLNVPAHKVASFELVDLALIRQMARTGKPLIMSTGMATLGEIEEAVNAARSAGGSDIALLRCSSAYPASPESIHLQTIPFLSGLFGVPAGLSDHTLGIAVPVASVALGACIIEKHFTLSRSYGGPDSVFSLEPSEFQAMVTAVRTAEQALGGIHFGPTESELKSRKYRRSLFVVEPVHTGEQFTEKNVRSIRPGDGLAPKYLDAVLGSRARLDIAPGTPLDWHLMEKAL